MLNSIILSLVWNIHYVLAVNWNNMREHPIREICNVVFPDENIDTQTIGEYITGSSADDEMQVKHPRLEKNTKWRNNYPSCEILIKH